MLFQTVLLNLKKEGQQTRFAVNLFSELESDIEPQESIEVGQEQVSGQATQPPGRREWWRWVALGGVIFFLVEWVVFWNEKGVFLRWRKKQGAGR